MKVWENAVVVDDMKKSRSGISVLGQVHLIIASFFCLSLCLEARWQQRVMVRLVFAEELFESGGRSVAHRVRHLLDAAAKAKASSNIWQSERASGNVAEVDGASFAL
jgi:hypothetical protein